MNLTVDAAQEFTRDFQYPLCRIVGVNERRDEGTCVGVLSVSALSDRWCELESSLSLSNPRAAFSIRSVGSLV